jgi:hypothetical protein
MNASRKLRFGTVWVNDHLVPLTSEMPHGGFKQSGYGKDMSIYSMEEYTQLKHVAFRSTSPSLNCGGGLAPSPPVAAVSRFGPVVLRSRSGVHELGTRLCGTLWAICAPGTLARGPVLPLPTVVARSRD